MSQVIKNASSRTRQTAATRTVAHIIVKISVNIVEY
jgi:hypothetical protein